MFQASYKYEKYMAPVDTPQNRSAQPCQVIEARRLHPDGLTISELLRPRRRQPTKCDYRR